MKIVDNDALAAAFRAHTEGQDKFTRRMAINIGDHFGLRPMQVIWQLQKLGLLKSGSYDWFQHHGGITPEHIEQVRQDRSAEQGGQEK